jgi:hypothetical protein
MSAAEFNDQTLGWAEEVYDIAADRRCNSFDGCPNSRPFPIRISPQANQTKRHARGWAHPAGNARCLQTRGHRQCW